MSDSTHPAPPATPRESAEDAGFIRCPKGCGKWVCVGEQHSCNYIEPAFTVAPPATEVDLDAIRRRCDGAVARKAWNGDVAHLITVTLPALLDAVSVRSRPTLFINKGDPEQTRDWSHVIVRQLSVMHNGERVVVGEAIKIDNLSWVVTFIQKDWMRDELIDDGFKSGTVINRAGISGEMNIYRHESGYVFNGDDP